MKALNPNFSFFLRIGGRGRQDLEISQRAIDFNAGFILGLAPKAALGSPFTKPKLIVLMMLQITRSLSKNDVLASCYSSEGE